MTLLIKNVRVLGAERENPQCSDVFVIGDIISAVGNFPNKKADEVIDGQGMYLAPGFIDVHGESDHHWSLLTHPAQDDLLRQGITSVLWGHNGVSIAPFIGRNFEVFQTWLDPHRLAVGWGTMKEALATLKSRSLGVNFATLVGETIASEAVLRGRQKFNASDFAALRKLLDSALNEGARGISIDPYPFARTEFFKRELDIALELLQAHSGILTIGSPAGLPLERLREILDWLPRDGAVKIIFTNAEHFAPDSLQLLLSAAESIPNLYFEISPFEADTRPLYAYLPRWAWRKSVAHTQAALNDSWHAGKVLSELPKTKPEKIWIMKSEKSPALAGLSLKETMSSMGLKKAEQTILAVMREAGLGTLVLESKMNQMLLKKILAHPRALVGSRGASVPQAERKFMAETAHDISAFPSFLNFAVNKKIYPLAEAVRRVTEVPARLLGIEKRGEIREGWYADLVGLKENNVAFTVVNGRIAWRDGENFERSGRLLVRNPRVHA